MLYLPARVWERKCVEGGGYYAIFKDERGRFDDVTQLANGSEPLFGHFTHWIELRIALKKMRGEGSLVPEQDFRISWSSKAVVSIHVVVPPL